MTRNTEPLAPYPAAHSL